MVLFDGEEKGAGGNLSLLEARSVMVAVYARFTTNPLNCNDASRFS